MRYSSGVITVPKGGFYYVYAAIFFYHHFESASIACGYRVYVNSISYINASTEAVTRIVHVTMLLYTWDGF